MLRFPLIIYATAVNSVVDMKLIFAIAMSATV